MTKETILKKAIEKAVKNGWDKRLGDVVMAKLRIDGVTTPNYYYFIFDHSFAKAFLNIKLNPRHRSPTHHGRYACVVCREENERWKKFLKEMVLWKDPILYLKKFLTKNRKGK